MPEQLMSTGVQQLKLNRATQLDKTELYTNEPSSDTVQQNVH